MVANYTSHRFCFVVIMGIYLLRHAVFVSGRPRSVGPMYADQDASPMAVWGYFWYALFLIWGISLGTAILWGKVRKQNKSNRFTK